VTQYEFIKMIPAIEDIDHGCGNCIKEFLKHLIKLRLIDQEWVTLVKVCDEFITLNDLEDE